ncbi:hypothetical protein MTO96_033283 [Rhipicephalus appendiculatus]
MPQRNPFLLVQLLNLVCSSPVLFSYRANRWLSMVSPCHDLQHPLLTLVCSSPVLFSYRANRWLSMVSPCHDLQHPVLGGV